MGMEEWRKHFAPIQPVKNPFSFVIIIKKLECAESCVACWTHCFLIFSLYNCKYFLIASQFYLCIENCILLHHLMVMDFDCYKKLSLIFFLVLFLCTFQASSASAHGVGSASRGAINAFSPTKPPIKTTTDDTPDFDRSKVRH